MQPYCTCVLPSDVRFKADGRVETNCGGESGALLEAADIVCRRNEVRAPDIDTYTSKFAEQFPKH
jgi:hypothetical protein